MISAQEFLVVTTAWNFCPAGRREQQKDSEWIAAAQ
jgi:hypothetical protein